MPSRRGVRASGVPEDPEIVKWLSARRLDG